MELHDEPLQAKIGQSAHFAAYVTLKNRELADPEYVHKMIVLQQTSVRADRRTDEWKEANRIIKGTCEFDKERKYVLDTFGKQMQSSACTFNALFGILESYPYFSGKDSLVEAQKCDICNVVIPFPRRFTFKNDANQAGVITVRSDFDAIVTYLHVVLQFDIITRVYLYKNGGDVRENVEYLAKLWEEAKRTVLAYCVDDKSICFA